MRASDSNQVFFACIVINNALRMLKYQGVVGRVFLNRVLRNTLAERD